MPKPREVLNAFTAAEVKDHTGISVHMINYLVREGFLTPAYGHGTRGSVRYYSYRDLVAGRIIQRLREAGVQITKLKEGIQKLSQERGWLSPSKRKDAELLRLLVTDGKRLLTRSGDGFLDELNGQRSFAFVIELENVTEEVRRRIPAKKRRRFDMRNQPLEFEEPPKRLNAG
jgi:DNA-binding transcriptional MerR regulator